MNNSGTVKYYENKLHDVLYSKKHIGAEANGDFQVAVGYAQITRKRVVLYGNLVDMDCFVHYFKSINLNILCIINRLNENIGEKIFGIPVYNEEWIKEQDLNDCVVFSMWFEQGEKKEFLEKLKKKIHVFYFDSIARLIMSVKSVPNDVDRTYYYIKNEEILKNLLKYCVDKESCEVFIEYIRTWIERDVYRLPEIPTVYKYFGEPDKQIYKPLKNEKWINFGASTGDTLWAYFLNNLSCEKIYAIEADKDRFIKLKEHISMLPPIFAKKCLPCNIFVQSDTDVERLVHGEKITLINADIEGYEMDMLRAFQKVIRRDKPVLALCMYHKKEDFIDIPQYILELSNEYSFVIRKYAHCIGDRLRNMEIVLYAIPSDRRILL